MGNSNKIKANFLGMPYGTANGRLKKKIMFNLLQRLEEDKCYRCRKIIEDINELSIEHKKPWLHVNKELFWDLENISFSHLNCNTIAKRIPQKIKNITGKCWCYRCKSYLPYDKFSIGMRKDGSTWCRKCDAIKKREYRKRTGKR